MKHLYESWRHWLSEEILEPGSFPVDGAGQSGIPQDPRVGGQNSPAPGHFRGDGGGGQKETTLQLKKIVEQHVARYWSMEALMVSPHAAGDHRHLSAGKALKSVQEKITEKLKDLHSSQSPAGKQIIIETISVEEEAWKAEIKIATKYFKFPKKWGKFADHEGISDRWTNVEMFINRGMPKKTNYHFEYGSVHGKMQEIISLASQTLKEYGFEKFSIGGSKTIFKPSGVYRAKFPAGEDAKLWVIRRVRQLLSQNPDFRKGADDSTKKEAVNIAFRQAENEYLASRQTRKKVK